MLVQNLYEMKNVIVTLFVALLSCICVSARSYNGTLYTFTQPDGDSVTVRLFGNDFYLQAESLDGYTLTVDPDDGYICYALVSADSSDYASSGIRYRGGEVAKAVTMIVAPHQRISSDALARKIAKGKETLGIRDELAKPELRSATVLPDTIYGVTVLIDFPDCKFPFSMAELNKFLNGEGSINGNTMSIREYFSWISNGKLTYINYLPKAPHTMPNEKSYYAPSDASTYTFDRLQPAVLDALNGFSKSVDGFDLNDLSRNGSSYYAVNILYAGECPNKWATGLWPHKGTMRMQEKNAETNTYRSFYQLYQLAYCSEKLGMGTFVHESFHLLLGAPDFYPFDNHTGNTAENFNVADEFFIGSPKNPPIPNPWILDNVGWLDNKIVLNDLEKGTRVELEYGPGNVAVYYGNVDGDPQKERYYIEVRNSFYLNQRIVNTSGIYIWHVYEPGDNRYKDNPDKLDCRPASNNNPFWSSISSAKVFSDDSTPNAKWNNGENSGIYLCNFSKPDPKMSFCYGECEMDDDDDGAGDDDDGEGDEIGGDSIQYGKLDLTNRDSLPNGKVGQSYYAKLNPVGGDGHYTIKWKDGLPAGLSLNSDFEIVGIPTATVKKYLKLLVCDGTGAQTEVWLKLTILEGDVPVSINDEMAGKSGISVVYENGAFSIASKQEDLFCSVYSTNGLKLEEIRLACGSVRIFGADYPKGVYLLDLNGKHFKIVKY